MHFTSNILMISPEKFRSNEFTMNDNVFQSKEVVDSNVSKMSGLFRCSTLPLTREL